MNILKDLSIKSLKLNKKRTISTIIGIILSTALICATSILFKSFQQTLVDNAINNSGYYHLKINDASLSDLEMLKENRKIANVNSITSVGYATLNGSTNEGKPYVKVYSMDEDTFKTLKFRLVEGRMAKEDDELVISKHIITNGQVMLNVGDTVTFTIGKRMHNGEEVEFIQYGEYEDTYDSDESGEQYTETIEESITKTFKIVGIIERPAYSFEDYSESGYTVITNGLNSEKYSAYITLKNPSDYKESIANIIQANSYEEVLNNGQNSDKSSFKYTDYSINEELLRWEVFAFSDSTVTMLFGMVAVVIVTIIVTSIFCIRNSFEIATLEKSKMYGMLASIGSTKKQIKKSVVFEAMILGVVGCVIGVLSGILASLLLIKIVNLLIGDYLFEYANGVAFKISVIYIILSVVLGIITVYISAMSSAKKASKISPIESIRNLGDIKVKGNKLNAPKVIEKVFKEGGVLAYKNLKRSSKKYSTTVISLAVSITIFIVTSSFISNVFEQAGAYYTEYDYNVEISSIFDVSDEKINEMLSLDGIKNYYVLYDGRGSILLKDLSKVNYSDEYPLAEVTKYNKDTDEYEKTGEYVEYVNVLGLDDASFKKYAKKIGANYDEIKDKVIICDYYYEINNGSSAIALRRYNYSKGDTMLATLNDENEYKEVAFDVGAITSVHPYGFENSYYDNGFIVVNADRNKDLEFARHNITIDANEPEKLVEELNKIKDMKNNFYVTDLDKMAREQNSMILVMQIFLYGFIAVITLIGVTNIFNTITSNMELREKEFAMLKSIGMTKKEFNRMINLETIFYSTKALFYGIIFGLFGTLLLYKAASVKIDYGMYIPIKPIIISIIAVNILVYVIMRYSINKVNKQNVIETIRKDNI